MKLEVTVYREIKGYTYTEMQRFLNRVYREAYKDGRNSALKEAEDRRCTETECYFNEDLMCKSTSDTWDPLLLEKCPDYTED